MLILGEEKDEGAIAQEKQQAAQKKMDAFLATISEATTRLSKTRFYDPAQAVALKELVEGVANGMRELSRPLDLSPFLQMMAEIKEQNKVIIELISKMQGSDKIAEALLQLRGTTEERPQVDFPQLLAHMQTPKSEPVEWRFKVSRNSMDGSTEISATPQKK